MSELGQNNDWEGEKRTDFEAIINTVFFKMVVNHKKIRIISGFYLFNWQCSVTMG